MTTNVAIAPVFRNNMSYEEMADALMSTTESTNNRSILVEIAKLPVNELTRKMGILSLAASAGVKKNIQEVVETTGTNIPAAWMTANTLNFTMFAMTGHLMMLLPDSELLAHARSFRRTYKASLGGSKDLKEFGTTGSVAGRTKRTEILREWAERVKDADLDDIQAVFSSKFPSLVRSPKSVARFLNPMYYVGLFFSIIFRIIFWVLELILTIGFYGRMKYVSIFLILMMLNPRLFVINIVSFLYAAIRMIFYAIYTFLAPVSVKGAVTSASMAAGTWMEKNAPNVIPYATDAFNSFYAASLTMTFWEILTQAKDETINGWNKAVPAIKETYQNIAMATAQANDNRDTTDDEANADSAMSKDERTGSKEEESAISNMTTEEDTGGNTDIASGTEDDVEESTAEEETEEMDDPGDTEMEEEEESSMEMSPRMDAASLAFLDMVDPREFEL